MRNIESTVERIRQKYRKDANFNESDHSRDENGRFTSNGGGSSHEKGVNSLKKMFIDEIKRWLKPEYRDEVSEKDFDYFEKGLINDVERVNKLCDDILKGSHNNLWEDEYRDEIDKRIEEMTRREKSYRDEDYEYEAEACKKALSLMNETKKRLSKR